MAAMAGRYPSIRGHVKGMGNTSHAGPVDLRGPELVCIQQLDLRANQMPPPGECLENRMELNLIKILLGPCAVLTGK